MNLLERLRDQSWRHGRTLTPTELDVWDKTCVEAADEIEKLQKGIDDVVGLIDDSHGVTGLHLNGDVAPWGELLAGGRFGEWLENFCKTTDAAKRLAEPPIDNGPDSVGAMAAQLIEQEAEIKQLFVLLDCRAGKLLLKGKPFIVVANDEPYFTSVYLVIREAEKAKGRWTDECEKAFQQATHYDHEGEFPDVTPELQSVLRDQRKSNEQQTEIERLQALFVEIAEMQIDPSGKHGLTLWNAVHACKHKAGEAAEKGGE